MTRTISVTLDGTFRLLSTLIEAELVAGGRAKWPTQCQTLILASDKDNGATDRIEFKAPGDELGLELATDIPQRLEDHGGCNGISTMDKMFRIVTAAGAGSAGQLNVIMLFA